MARELDPEALAQLRAALVGQAHRQLHDRHEAEDVAQDALVALYTTSVQFTDLDHVAAYARRTVHNLCVDHIRRRVRQVQIEHADGSYDTIERDVVNRDLIAAVISGLSEINPVYAQVIVASTDVGRDHAAIAALTGVSLRNVRHGLDRGSKALKAKLAAAGHSIPAVLVPMPVRVLFKAISRSGRRRLTTAGGAAALLIPTLTLLLPNFLLHPRVGAPPTALDRGSLADGVDTKPLRTKRGSDVPQGRGALSPVAQLDREFAQDGRQLLRHNAGVKDSGDCIGATGHGLCSGETAPGDYVTIPMPLGPPLQVYFSMVPCSEVPMNPVTTCEPPK